MYACTKVLLIIIRNNEYTFKNYFTYKKYLLIIFYLIPKITNKNKAMYYWKNCLVIIWYI